MSHVPPTPSAADRPAKALPAEFSHPALQELMRVGASVGSVDSQHLRTALVEAELAHGQHPALAEPAQAQDDHLELAAAVERIRVHDRTEDRAAAISDFDTEEVHPERSHGAREIGEAAFSDHRVETPIGRASRLDGWSSQYALIGGPAKFLPSGERHFTR